MSSSTMLSEGVRIATCLIAVMDPVSGPHLLRRAPEAVDSPQLSWLVNLALSDRNAALWPAWDCLFDVKVTHIEQLDVCLMAMMLREHVDDVAKSHMVPTYVVGFTGRSSTMRERLVAILSSLKDRFSLLAMKMLSVLRDATGEVAAAAPPAVVDHWWMDAQIVDAHLRQWIRCWTPRPSFDATACRITGLADKNNPQTIVRFMAYLSGALAHRRLIVRGNDAKQVQWWIHAILMFLPDDKLLLCSTECHSSLDDVIPELYLQGTTLSITPELLRHTLWSQYPVAILDTDRQLHDPAHRVPPSLSESPHEWTDYKNVREGFLMGTAALDVTAKFPLKPWGQTSELVAEVVGTIERIYSNVQRRPDVSINDSFSSSHGVLAGDWCAASRLAVVPAIDQWRRRLKLLACRSLFSELSTTVFDKVPKMSPESNDILLNVVNFNHAVEKTNQIVRQAGARFDEF